MPRKVVGDATKIIGKAMTKRLARDTGGDYRLSGAPTRLRVQTRVTGDTVVEATVAPNKAGMAQWVWINEGTGEPGPTPAKRTWDEPASEQLDVIGRYVRHELNRIMR